MAWDATDWTVTRSTKVIDYTGDDHGGGSPTYVTLMEFTRALQALGDDPEYSGDDEYDIVSDTFESRQTDNFIRLINGWTVTDAAIEHIYDGTILQDSDGTRWDGFVNYGNADVQIQIIQDGAVLTDDWWNESGAGLNPLAASGISHRFMLKTINAGTDIDNRNLLGTCRRFNYTYSEFQVTGAAPGNNTLALSDQLDLNNETVAGTVATYDQFTNDNEGYIGIDVDNDTTDEFYYSSWDIGGGATPASPVINDLYEYLKYITRDGSGSTLYGLSGELFRGITHQVAISGGAGTWVEPESLSWGSGGTAGTGQLLAVDNTTASSSTTLWMQLLTGVVPAANTITGNGGATATAGTVTARPVSRPFNGASIGSAIIGSYGLGVDTTDLSKDDKVVDLTNTQITPPNNVTFTVFGLVSGEDRVLVTNDDSGGIDYAQMTLNGALSSGTTTSVVVNGTIPTDTPTAATIRIERDSGLYSRHTATWVSGGSTFTIPSADFSVDGAANSNNVFISYLDLTATATSENFTVVYNADRTLFVRVRDGGASPIKTFETTATLNTNGGSATAIRTSDA